MLSPGREPRVNTTKRKKAPGGGDRIRAWREPLVSMRDICRRSAAVHICVAPILGLTPQAMIMPLLRSSRPASPILHLASWILYLNRQVRHSKSIQVPEQYLVERFGGFHIDHMCRIRNDNQLGVGVGSHHLVGYVVDARKVELANDH